MVQSPVLRSAIVVCSLALAGCGGGSSVEDQERFQLNRSSEVATADMVRSEVQSLADSLNSEGGQGLQDTLQYATENFESINPSALSEEDQAKVEQIKSMVSELASGSASQADAQEKIQQMQDLANQLPKGDATAPATE